MPLFLAIYCKYRYSMKVDEENIYTCNISVGVRLWFCLIDVGLQLVCIRAVCIDMILLGFKSVEELYPSPPLGVVSADTSQLPKEKKLHGQF
jgi:hypothetical protein